MTAVSLLDAMTRDTKASAVDVRTLELAGQLVEAALAERLRVCRFEAEFAPTDWGDGQAVMEFERSIHALYAEWAAEAEQVLVRVRGLVSAGMQVRDAVALEHAYASTLSRLKFTPEKTARGMEQAHRGEFTP